MHPGNPTMLNNSNPLLSKACLTNSNLNHFKMTEAMGLRIIASRPPWMASRPYQISWKSTKLFTIYPQILYTLKPAMPLGPFLPFSTQLALVSIVTSLPLCRVCATVNYIPWLRQLHQLKIVCDITIVTQQCKQSQIIAEQGWKSCNKLTALNLNHFKMIEAMGLNIIARRSPWVASPPYQISWKSTMRFESW
jgi:hypothetical protein